MTGYTWLDIILYIIIIGGFLWYFWGLYSLVESINEGVENLKEKKHSQILSNFNSLKSLITSNKNEIISSIGSGNKSIKEQIATLKQMIQSQFASQTVLLLESIEKNRKSVIELTAMLQTVQSQTNKGLRDNNHKLSELSNSLTYIISDSTNMLSSQLNQSIKKLDSDNEKRSESVLFRLDKVFRAVSDFNKTIESHLKLLEDSEENNSQKLDSSINALSSTIRQHKDNISSICSQVLNAEKELHKGTKHSFDIMSNHLSGYLNQLKQIDTLYGNLQRLYTKILEEESKISNQEASLTSMVSRHTQILEITSEMNKTSKEIFEFMKLYLINSTLDNLKK